MGTGKNKPVKKTTVVIEVWGGTVDAVYSNDPALNIRVQDWDAAAVDYEYRQECDRLKSLTASMNRVYRFEE